jgi:hypothetical protein
MTDITPKTITDDGYEIIPPRREAKGIQCGLCQMKFDYGKTYGYACQRVGCPVMRVKL